MTGGGGLPLWGSGVANGIQREKGVSTREAEVFLSGK